MAERLLGLRVRIPPGACLSLLSALLSGRGLCDGPIPRPEESYRQWCVIVCDIESLNPQWVVTPVKEEEAINVAVDMHYVHNKQRLDF